MSECLYMQNGAGLQQSCITDVPSLHMQATHSLTKVYSADIDITEYIGSHAMVGFHTPLTYLVTYLFLDIAE